MGGLNPEKVKKRPHKNQWNNIISKKYLINLTEAIKSG